MSNITAIPASRSPLEAALDMVETLADARCVVVPRTPSREMLTAGCRAGNVSPAVAWSVYEAMIRHEK